MKTIKTLLILAFALTISSCKNDEKTTTESSNEVEVKSTFKITLNAIVKKDDSFQIYYREDNNAESPFTEDQSLYSGFKGSDASQDIVFNLPEDAIPTSLRFDFGTNKDQSEIVINSFKVEYLGKKFETNASGFSNYFRPDEAFVKIDKQTGRVTPITAKDGNYDPMFYSMESLDVELMKLSK